LTNQSKATSSGFLKVYSLLSEAPDPYPLLEASIDSLLVSEDTVPKITNENKELQQTVSRLTSQLDSSEKRLEAEAVARKSIEDGQESRLKEVEASWTAVLEEKRDNWASKEKILEDKVESQERLLKEVKASYEVSQRLDRSESDENEGPRGGAMAAELEMINADLERTSMRLAEVESRNEQLRVELAQSASQSQQHPLASLEESPVFIRLQSENSSLLRKLDASRSERESQKRELETKVKSMERQTTSIRRDRDGLKDKVQSWSDYDDVKRELEMLRVRFEI
jgi:homeobox protein cut-like